MNNEDVNIETKQERREKKLEKKKEQMQKHGRSTARMYIDAIFKRLGRKKK